MTLGNLHAQEPNRILSETVRGLAPLGDKFFWGRRTSQRRKAILEPSLIALSCWIHEKFTPGPCF